MIIMVLETTPVRAICNTFGVDYLDKTTGRWYPKLPPVVIFVCEAP